MGTVAEAQHMTYHSNSTHAVGSTITAAGHRWTVVSVEETDEAERYRYRLERRRK